jgi:hypothetical protein
MFMGINSWVRVTHEIHEYWSFTNKDDSPVFQKKTKLCFFSNRATYYIQIRQVNFQLKKGP